MSGESRRGRRLHNAQVPPFAVTEAGVQVATTQAVPSKVSGPTESDVYVPRQALHRGIGKYKEWCVLCSYVNLTERSLQETVDGLTNNQDLRTVLTYSWGDYGMICL